MVIFLGAAIEIGLSTPNYAYEYLKLLTEVENLFSILHNNYALLST